MELGSGSWDEIFFFRVEYLEKSKHLQDQLRELRSEIEVLKVGEKQSELDQLHDEQVRLGETKYSTLRKVSSIGICIHVMGGL
jgi:merlin protein